MGILQAGIQPMPPALEAWSVNHRTAWKVPRPFFFPLGWKLHWALKNQTTLKTVVIPSFIMLKQDMLVFNSLLSYF